jgi:Spy/CpxP family protein refolding chaperone
MKKLFTVVCAMFVFVAVSSAQTTEAKATETKAPTKEEKQKMKEKQEADLAAAFKEIGLTDEQVQQVKAVMDATNQKNKELRMDATLSDDDKKAKMKVNNDEKNEKIKSIMGDEKYKQFNAIKKKQKEAATTQPAGN